MKKFLSLLLAFVLYTNLSVTALALEPTFTPSESQMSFSDNKISISLSENIEVEFIEYNVVLLTDMNTGETEILPTETIDMNGNPLSLSYVKTSDGIDIYPTTMTRWGWWDGVKCIAGVVGSAGGGLIAGSSVGTITIPGVGTISGLIIGSISGGLVGIASFC